jgi:hypothetical protein
MLIFLKFMQYSIGPGGWPDAGTSNGPNITKYCSNHDLEICIHSSCVFRGPLTIGKTNYPVHPTLELWAY